MKNANGSGVSYADVTIIGAGASGLMAACAAAGAGGAKVLVLERNDRPGVKLGITGKGRCNITNDAEKEQFIRNIPGNGKFLFSAFSKMSNRDIVAFFNGIGVETALERGGRYFTKSGSAREVTAALARKAAESGAEFAYGARVVKITANNNGESGFGGGYRYSLKLGSGGAVCANAAVVATGGVTYPSTGSTGDGYGFAEGFGHSVVEPRPSLVPLETFEDWPRGLSGLTLKNVALKLYSQDSVKLYSKQGEMLFTHFGISGPLVLSGSRALLDRGVAGCAARIDLKPALSDEKLRARIARDFEFYAKKRLKNAMADLMPLGLIPVVINQAGLDEGLRADAVGNAGRAKLSEAVKGLKLTVSAARPASEAIVTAGGVNTKEIAPSTMESKLAPGLFFCGEVIDVDAYTGGFNISIAFATGRAAGAAAAASVHQKSDRFM